MKFWSGSFRKGIPVETTDYVGEGQHWDHFIGHIKEMKVLGIRYICIYICIHIYIHTFFLVKRFYSNNYNYTACLSK